MIRWIDEGHRLLAMSGDAAIGAVFPRVGQRNCRWRAWVTKNMNPVESTAVGVDRAKQEVEQRFAAFLELAGLRAK